jgi:transposase
MWAFRKRPDDLSDTQKTEVDELLRTIPDLELPYHFRWAITRIFETSTSGEEAAARFEELRRGLSPDDADQSELLTFFGTYDAHRDAILAYFDDRKTSGPVEGLNNKARVITKRCYGVKTTKTLWNRLCLDVNLAANTVLFSVRHIHQIANQIRDVFLGYYT